MDITSLQQWSHATRLFAKTYFLSGCHSGIYRFASSLEPPHMPRLTRKLPSCRHHKPSGKAVVTLDGRDHYLGDFGTPESRAEYDRLIAEYLANRRMRPAANPAIGVDSVGSSDLTINEVLLAFWRHAERHYRTPSGAPSKELANFRDAFRPLRQLYGCTVAREFSPLRLKALRQH
jgi:hypothetical protein